MTAPSFRLAALLGLFWSSVVFGQEAVSIAGLTAEPGQLTLLHAEDLQRLLVTGKMTDGSVRDVSRIADYTSSNSAVAEVNVHGIVHPVAAGQAIIKVQCGVLTIQVSVTVVSAQRRPVSFANDVMPLLSRAGCNSGACHGAASGKKGFKLCRRATGLAALHRLGPHSGPAPWPSDEG